MDCNSIILEQSVPCTDYPTQNVFESFGCIGVAIKHLRDCTRVQTARPKPPMVLTRVLSKQVNRLR